ncbi:MULTISPECIES: protein translocase subunit SecF [Methanobacterium]|uniref:Protein-export membrane protein SecF n=1 Tax=Methanobacterium subterraneum TaxID=59277 RepID=A0A7K4DLM4_9EURY|nr:MULTISPECIES: protein translocase subunit SecF [Methanobacterium]AUB58970.1 preprotein translocase subunit SecF [Methanobacterium sp. MZ-A1]MCC7560808.1 protein translocase subunit SecF [Methanobacterium sp.]NMO08705.1 protein translocase subunit SecF [Methanobacterium subterraneum]
MITLERFLESYKPLIAIPLVITIISLVLIATMGINEGIELKGGTVVVIELEKSVSQNELQSIISSTVPGQQVDVKSINNDQATVDITGDTDVVKISAALKETGTITSYRSVGPVLSAESMTQIYYALAFAFIFMSITVFIIFRDVVPSMAIILAAISDIVIAVGGMSLFGIPLSIASVGALLMLIGYSVDTDILLTTRVLKRKEGTITQRAKDAMKTGITMAITSTSSMVALYLVVVFLIPAAQTLADIAAVLIIGLLADIMTTWLMNLGILRWYTEARQ